MKPSNCRCWGTVVGRTCTAVLMFCNCRVMRNIIMLCRVIVDDLWTELQCGTPNFASSCWFFKIWSKNYNYVHSCIPITSLLPCAGQLKTSVFCDAILCYLVDRYQQFGQSYCLHFLGGVWWWWQHVLYTHLYLSSKLVGITSLKTVVFVSNCCEIVKSEQIYCSWKVLATQNLN